MQGGIQHVQGGIIYLIIPRIVKHGCLEASLRKEEETHKAPLCEDSTKQHHYFVPLIASRYPSRVPVLVQVR